MEAIMQVIKGQDIQDGDMSYSLVKSLLKEMPNKSSKMKKHVKRLRTARCLLNALRLLLNTYSPRRRKKLRKSTSRTSFPVPDRVTATKISCKEFVDVLEDGI
eukprot:274512-Ditylum_brightwellii.AAC.1